MVWCGAALYYLHDAWQERHAAPFQYSPSLHSFAAASTTPQTAAKQINVARMREKKKWQKNDKFKL